MRGTNKALMIGVMMGMAAVVAPAPPMRAQAERTPMMQSTGNRLLDMLSGVKVGGTNPRYIKRPFHTTAEMKRKAIKARNRRRHKLAMKRKH